MRQILWMKPKTYLHDRRRHQPAKITDRQLAPQRVLSMDESRRDDDQVKRNSEHDEMLRQM